MCFACLEAELWLVNQDGSADKEKMATAAESLSLAAQVEIEAFVCEETRPE